MIKAAPDDAPIPHSTARANLLSVASFKVTCRTVGVGEGEGNTLWEFRLSGTLVLAFGPSVVPEQALERSANKTIPAIAANSLATRLVFMVHLQANGGIWRFAV